MAHGGSGGTPASFRVVVARTYQAFFTPTSTRARAGAYTPSSSSYPPPDPTHFMSENEDAMKYKQGAGPDGRSHSPYKPRKRAHAQSQTE